MAGGCPGRSGGLRLGPGAKYDAAGRASSPLAVLLDTAGLPGLSRHGTRAYGPAGVWVCSLLASISGERE